MIHPNILPNSLRTVIYPQKGTQAVTVLILVGVGSRYEKAHERGISHFLEHMFFKGGAKYKNAKEVAAAIDGVGGDFNAFTGKEYTGFYVKLAKDNVDVAFDVLADMLISARFDQVEIEKERGVILEEYNLYQDTPIYQIGWDFENLLFGDQSLGWDQIGTKETIRSFHRDDFVNYKRNLYGFENTAIIVTGNITEQEAMQKINAYFPAGQDQKNRNKEDFTWPNNPQRISIKNKKTEQGHLVMGFPGIPFGDDREFATRLLSVIMGGNMSSRMFTVIREELSLCYSIRTSTDHYSDVGVISTHAGVDLNRFEEAVKAIKNEYTKAFQGGFTEQELVNAKNFLRGKITLRLEDSEEMASFLGTQTILKGQVKTPEEIFAGIESVSKGEIDQLARELFDPAKLSLAAIGPFEDLEERLREVIIR